MRTAKEICKDSIKNLGYGTDEAFVQQILDDAIAHGMTIAAEICVRTEWANTCQDYASAILSARDKLPHVTERNK